MMMMKEVEWALIRAALIRCDVTVRREAGARITAVIPIKSGARQPEPSRAGLG
ncbi:hypothetical protein JOB18_018668 [Solea senegalensis]|uniref:Uncharacterized protein n=1 Tax=Solea senegalensis TaxID=28829 RepID=A0AAV6R0L3_SOLSE|nr:hypothetical protein JOB18_018668 [Solea senegalensis]